MPNIMLTSRCNLKCDYCFARDMFTHVTPAIPVETFEKITKFIVNGGEKYIGLIGGEPLLHPQFDKIVATALQYTDPDHVTLFTNGIMIDKHIDVLKKSMIRVMINCNGESILGDQRQRFLDNIALCAKELYWNKVVTPSYNLYRPDQDFSEFLNLVDEYPVTSIRVAIASPETSQRSMMPTDYFNVMRDVAIKFFSEINRRKIRIVMDCNIIPNCMQEDIIRNVSHPFVSRFPKSVCRPVLDFCIDETVIRCFSLSDIRVDMNQFSSLAQLYGYFTNLCDSIAYSRPSELKCKECFERKCMGCMNGCLSFNARRTTLLEH